MIAEVGSVVYMKGMSKSGSNYDFRQVRLVVPAEGFKNDAGERRVSGIDLADINLSNDCFDRFVAAKLEYPVSLNLTLDQVVRNGRVESEVTDFKLLDK